MPTRPDHDAGYQQLFSHPELVRDLIQGFIPDAWLNSLDYSTSVSRQACLCGSRWPSPRIASL